MLLLDNSLINFQAECWLKHHFTCKFISMVNTLSFMTFNQIPFKIKFKLWQPCQICSCTCVKNKLTTLVIYKDTFIYFCLCWFSGGQSSSPFWLEMGSPLQTGAVCHCPPVQSGCDWGPENSPSVFVSSPVCMRLAIFLDTFKKKLIPSWI